MNFIKSIFEAMECPQLDERLQSLALQLFHTSAHPYAVHKYSKNLFSLPCIKVWIKH